ncbi:MAG: DUF177 domain-containing protein [Bryobacteraceae bacterium]
MFLAVNELELRKVPFDVSFAPGKLDLLDKTLDLKEPLAVKGSAELAGVLDEIRVRGHIRGRLQCECDLCLEAFDIPVDGDFSLSYRPAESLEEASEVEIAGEETDIGFYEGAGIELADVVREQVLLWLPMQRTCRADCKGICPQCGRNRNTGDCGCQKPHLDERWAALQKLTGD